MPSSVANNPDKDLPTDGALEGDGRWQLVKRVSVSASFSRSPRLAHLLLYLCEQAIQNRKSLLTEQNLAYTVFDRKSNFDPSADTIVRSQMVRLRQRLEAYFREEGQDEPLRVSIPKGGYVPIFESLPVTSGKDEPSVSSVSPVTPEAETQNAVMVGKLRATVKRLCVVCIALGVFTMVFGILLMNRKPSEPLTKARENTPRHHLWEKLFDKGVSTTIVAADSGIVMLHGGTGKNTNLSEYLSRNFTKELALVSAERQKELLLDASRRYTSFVDLELFDRLTHLPEAVPGSYSIRFARDINVDDLKKGNIILSGSQDANPWIELFEPGMNFVLHDDLIHGVRAFLNRNPKPGEDSVYAVSQDEYGVLAFLPNLSGTGNVLIVEGTSTAGTQAISDFLFMDSELDPFLRKISEENGAIPKFEILLKSRPLGGNSSRSHIVAYRTY